MSNPDPDSQPSQHLAREFVTTHWSAVLQAGDAECAEADQALEYLCRSYWYPLYAYVRRQGHPAHDAQDLTQDFFARLLERKYLRFADPQRGRFRTFLLSSLKNFLINEWEKSRTMKRGGDRAIFSWDEETAEGRYRAEPVDGLTPDRIYEKRWAVTLLEKVMARLREKCAADSKGPLFARQAGRLSHYGCSRDASVSHSALYFWCSDFFPLHDESAPPARRQRNRMKICRCCRGRMNVCSPRNPNICLDCEALMFDDSPLLLASQTEAECAPQESAGDWSNEHGSAQQVPAGGDPNGDTGGDAALYETQKLATASDC